MKKGKKPPATKAPTIEVGQTIRVTQDGAEVGFDERLKVGVQFYIIGHRYKSTGSFGGMVGMWKVQPVRGDGKPFETPWLGRPEIIRLKPIPCPGGCGSNVAPAPDGSINFHGSLGWSCDGKKVRKTGDGI